MRDRPEPSRAPYLPRAAYRAILRLYPRRVRDRVGDDQLRLFEELWIDERPRAFPASSLWTLRACVRGLVTAAALHRDERRRFGARARRRPLMDLITLDLRQAWRAAVRRPAATLGPVAVVGLGVGLTAAMFVLADPYVLRPLPYADPDRLVVVEVSSGALRALTRATTIPTLAEWQARTDVFSGLAGSKVAANVRVRTAEGAALLKIGSLSSNAFDVLGIRAPDLAALIDAGQRRDAGLGLTMRGQRVLGDALGPGRTLELPNGQSLPILAIVPRSLIYPGDQRTADLDAWSTFDAGPIVDVREWQPSGRPAVSEPLRMIGRLAAGVTVDQARDALAFPNDAGQPIAIEVRPLADVMIGDARRSLALGALAAALGVLLACAGHAANLLLAGALHRTRERDTRAALGATRWALARLTVVETALVAAAAAVVALVVCVVALAMLAVVIPLEYSTLGAPSLTWRAVAFIVVAVIATMAVASLPAAAVRHLPVRSLASGDRDTGGRGLRIVRFTITAAQSALVVVLAIGAAMLLRSQQALMTQDTGYDYPVVAVSVRYPEQLKDVALQAEVDKSVDALRRRFGDNVAVVSGAMLNDSRSGTVVSVDGKGGPVDLKAVTPEFFRVAGLKVIAGRELQPSDSRRTAVVVNQAFTRRYWPDGSAVGRTIQFGRNPAAVVGVAEDGFDVALDVAPAPTVFTLFESPGSPFAISFILSPSGQTDGFETAITHALISANRDIVVRDVSRIGERLLLSVRDRIFATLVVLFFALAAIGVSMAGVIGIVAFIVGRRTREIAIRLAIGARGSQVRRLVLIETLVAVATGAAAGLVAGQWLSKGLESLLYRVQPGDWLTASLAAIATLVVMTLAANIPATRAARLPPSIALRVE